MWWRRLPLATPPRLTSRRPFKHWWWSSSSPSFSYSPASAPPWPPVSFPTYPFLVLINLIYQRWSALQLIIYFVINFDNDSDVAIFCNLLWIYVDKLNGDPLVGLFFVAMAHALVVAVMISAGFRISGGHLNPAVTLGLLAGGHITVVRSILYWIDQLLASVAACALLNYMTGGMVRLTIFI